MKHYTVDTPLLSLWWKWANLEFLKSIKPQSFIVPDFLVMSDFSEETVQRIKTFFHWKKVAVRSSWKNEDSKEQSLAGFYKTELDVPIEELEKAITSIHTHSESRSWERIPLVIQDMVNSEESWIIFTHDTDTNKPYYVIQIWKGKGESLVGWEQKWEIYKIFVGAETADIPYENLRRLVEAVREIQSKYSTPYIDIEFAFLKNDNIPRILQVRPIVMRNLPAISKARNLAYRYARQVAYFLEKIDDCYGDMIDINPRELVWSQPIIVQEFFKHIFPETSLIESRRYLGYWVEDNIMVGLIGNPYISLKKDLSLFLPKVLPERIKQRFRSYYKDLLITHPELQNSLDTVHYPVSLEKLKEIMKTMGLSKEEETLTFWIFESFFEEMEKKLKEFIDKSESLMINLMMRISELTWKNLKNIWSLSEIDYGINDITNINLLIEVIRESTYLFCMAARGAFYFSNLNPHIEEGYFRKNKYESWILRYLKQKWLTSIPFISVEWFNFTKIIQSAYTVHDLEKMVNEENEEATEINLTTRFMVERENMKYIFSRLFLILYFTLKKADMIWRDSINLADLLWENQWSSKSGTERRNKRVEVNSILQFPGVLHSKNHPLFFQIPKENAFYIGKWSIQWKVFRVKNVSELEGRTLEWLIICIDNATPEIDIFLPQIRAIVTKNGWPLAHIAIRAREYWIPSIVWLGEKFEKIQNWQEIVLDFTKEEVQYIEW